MPRATLDLSKLYKPLHVRFTRSETVYSLVWFRTKDGMVCYDYKPCCGGNPFVTFFR